MLHIARNPGLKGLADMQRDKVYAVHNGKKLYFDILVPRITDRPEDRTEEDPRFPLIVFVQGSAWHSPDRNTNIPQLSRFAQAGFVCANVTHRSVEDTVDESGRVMPGDRAPAYLIDVKTAVRYLRAHAAEYHIDPGRVYSFGTSSGGHTAQMLALTPDDPAYRTEEYPGYSDGVQAAASCFGTVDMVERADIEEAKAAAAGKQGPVLTDWICGGKRDDALLREISPIFRVEKGKKYPPFFIAHGDDDHIVPFSQSVRMVKALEETGCEVSFVCVDGADHEGSFWSEEILQLVLEFFLKQAR